MKTKEKVMKVVRDPKAQIGLSLAVVTLNLVIPQVSQSVQCPGPDENDCEQISGTNWWTCIEQTDWWDDCK
jgi:hypothetical protein